MKGIMFIEELFKAVIASEKTQTRRFSYPIIDEGSGYVFDKNQKYIYDIHDWKDQFIEDHARYHAGETVFLKEPYYLYPENPHWVAYKFDKDPLQVQYKWKNKMFMKGIHARYFIKIQDVKIEQLNEISQEDAKAEGVKRAPHRPSNCGQKLHSNNSFMDCWICSFKVLWNRINGKKCPWQNNPWVFVYEFELTPKPL